jgi:hypothetical protein
MSPTIRERYKRGAVTAGAAGLLAGAVLGILQILEQVIGAWHPKPEVSALLVAAAFLTSLWVAGQRNRRLVSAEFDARSNHLRDLVGVWPAPFVRDADPLRLGVFPTSRHFGSRAPYIPRATDENLSAALVAGAVILVCGERRAGASRTAFEAARSALADAVVLAPRGAGALRELTVLDPSLHLGNRHVLVWLDGLDRYVDALDAECLAAVCGVAGRVTVLATIRGELWREWLQATGAAGEAARALTADARVFEVPALLSTSEEEDARRLYPGTDFSGGAGMALASKGRDNGTPYSRQPERGEQGEPDPNVPWWHDFRVTVPAAGTCAVLGVLALFLATSGFTTPSITDQIAADEREGSQHERHAASVMQVDLHGTGVKSWVVLFRDDIHSRKASSDELRIYDQHGEKLVRAFRFKPVGKPAKFEERAVTDIDFDGAQEIVGGYGYADESEGGGAMVPFAIDWDRSRGRYVILSLAPTPPTLSLKAISNAEKQYLTSFHGGSKKRQREARTAERQYLAVYGVMTTFSDPHDRLQITGHRVQDFAVSPIPHRLIAGWYLRPLLHKRPAMFEVHTAIFDSATGAPDLRRCIFTGLHGPLLVPVGTDRAPYRTFEEAYANASRNRGCAPQYGKGL